MHSNPYADRREAGKALAELLGNHVDDPEVLILALPRGGVPVGYEVALALNAPLDVFLVRKLGAPGHEELAMGAIASGGVQVLNEQVIRMFRVTPEQIQAVTRAERAELGRRERSYRGERAPEEVEGRTIVLVDDGLATGSTMRAAAAALRRENTGRLVVAVPIASAQTCDELRPEVDEVICAITPERFQSVGQWYVDFGQTTDDEVRHLLELARSRPALRSRVGQP